MNFPCFPIDSDGFMETPAAAAAAPHHPLARPRATSQTGSYHSVERSDGSLFVRIDVPGVPNTTYYSAFPQDSGRDGVFVLVRLSVIFVRVCSTDREYEWFLIVTGNVNNIEFRFTIMDGIFRMTMPNNTGTLFFPNISSPTVQNGLVRSSQVEEGLHDCLPFIAYLPRPDENTDVTNLAVAEVYPQRLRGTGGVCTFEQVYGQYGRMLKITFDAPGTNGGSQYQLHINRTSPNMGWVEIRCDDGVVPRRVYSVAFATTCGCCFLDRANIEAVRNGMVTITLACLST